MNATVSLSGLDEDAEQSNPEAAASTAGVLTATAHDDVAAAIVASSLVRVGEAPSQPAGTVVSEEYVDNIGLPPTLDFLENVPDTFNGTAFQIKLYGEGCTECGHLVSTAEEKQTDCHFSKGNSFCPAAFTRIVFVGHKMRFLQKLQKAQKSKDTNRILKVLSLLETEDLETKEFVLREAGMLPQAEAAN